MATDASQLLRASDHSALIFDLGGVLISLAPERTVAALSELFGTDARQRRNATLHAELFDPYERGELSTAQFHAGLRAALEPREAGFPEGRVPTAEQINRAWCAMLGDIMAGTLDLLRHVGQRQRIFLLSNTNEVHYDHFLQEFERKHGAEFGSFESLFETAHTSHRMGARKPEARIFEQLIERHGLEPSTTLFLDDNQENVESAQRVGLRGVLHPSNCPLAERLHTD